jgi:UDP-N-acetyl-D-galactosamine dehydrogenase
MKIAIIGSGYVGLPLSIAFSKYYSVISYDINQKRVKDLLKGIDSNQQHRKKEILKKKLIFTSNKNLLKDNDIYIITVPTPIKSNNQPDLNMLKQASILVGKIIKKNACIIFESTTYPGCTEEFCVPLIQKFSKLKFEKDFSVAYSPERVNPGDKANVLKNIVKIVGANDNKTLLKVKSLYKKICRSVYIVNNIKVAEGAKVIENIQRDLNIALVNELSILFNKLNIPTNEVLNAANTKWNFHYYKPGLVGGHCISVDPYYLAYQAKKKKVFPKLILSGRRLNESMGKYVAMQTVKLLKNNSLDFNKSRVAVLGFAFKDNIPDIRNTKVIQILEYLRKKNIKFDVFDSWVSKEQVKKEYKIIIKDFKYFKKNKFDAIILVVSHKLFLKKLSFYSKFYKNNNKKIFIDVKNNYSIKDLNKNNFKYFQL